MYSVLTVNPDTVAADVVAAMSVQPPEVRLDVGSHLYSKFVAAPTVGRSAQSSVIVMPVVVAVNPVGFHGPLVLSDTAGGLAEVKPDFSPRSQTVYVVPVWRYGIVRDVSFERPSEPESGTSCHVITDGNEVWVPMRYAYSNPSGVPPDGADHVTVRDLLLPDVAATVGVMLGISVLTVAPADAADSPTSPVKSMRTWNWYSVVPSRLVTETFDSLCAPSLPLSATLVQGAPPVAVVKSPPLAVFLYLYCHWYAVNAAFSAAGLVQLSVSEAAATLEVVGAATVGVGVAFPDLLAGYDSLLLPVFLDRTWK